MAGKEMMKREYWISNDFCFGAIGFYPITGHKNYGSVLDLDGRARGWIGPDLVYDGDDGQAAMDAVEKAFYREPNADLEPARKEG